MKSLLLAVETKTEPWVRGAKDSYQKKIAAFFPFEVVEVKSPSLDRDDAAAKRKAEAEKILKALDDRDLVVLFDEGGKIFKNSEDFAAGLGKLIERSPSRLVFLIGGAFGVDESIKKRAQTTWSLSGLTFNHWVAQVAALEQIYRAMTILKRLPYHNR